MFNFGKRSQDLKVDSLKVGWKMLILTTISLIGMCVILGIFISYNKKNIYQEKKAQTERLVQVALGMIKHCYSLQQSGTFTLDQAQASVLSELSEIRFGDSEYFWINTPQGELILNPPDPSLEGMNMLNRVDKNYEALFHKYVEVAQAGGGWVQYWWPKPEGQEMAHKISYVTYFEEWDWILGTGIYLDDTDKAIERSILRGILLIIIIFIILSVSSMIISKRFIRKLRMIAIHDPLTTLFTRRYLYELVPLFMSHFERYKFQCLSVIYFDIDLFKMINDVYGHECGDRVLKGIGSIINNSIRKSDIGVRYGGDEFVLLIAANMTDEIHIIAERILQLTNNLVLKYNDRDVTVTLSAGVAFCSRGESFEDLLKRADDNLLKAKKAGKNRIVY